jgi:metal-sulfur cluster biosynthetic enzyme
LIVYVLITIALLLTGVLVYANRRQSRVTAGSGVDEPEVDLTFRPKVSDPEPTAPLIPGPRDPQLARMSTKELLKECQDPEIPLNIVDLGLVYEVRADKGSTVVKMSMTAPDCPSSHTITQDVRAKLEDAGFPNPKVDLVWDPPWSPERISESGRKTLGI